MFLINDLIIRSETEKKENGILEVNPLEEENLEATFYYFRLGKLVYKWDIKKQKWMTDDLSLPGNSILTIEPNEYLLIQSYERFRCSKQVFAIFGNSSRLTRQGLSLRHSPFIDPNFPNKKDNGFLEIGLKNEFNQQVKIKYQDIIGKISFFNVADTYPVSELKGERTKADFDRRKGSGGPLPLYPDHPVPGWHGVEDYLKGGRE
jgi:deoxycytidine triphosphate deaminase